MGPVTDDLGRFRIAGLLPGHYILSTMVSMDQVKAQVLLNGGGELPDEGHQHVWPEIIPVYAPGVFRRDEAKVFALEAEEQVDTDLTIDTAGLHLLQGRVYAGSDRHVPSGVIAQLREAIQRIPRASRRARQTVCFRFTTCRPESMC